MATRTKSTAARKPATPATPKTPPTTKAAAPKSAPPKPPVTPIPPERPSPVVTERARRGDLLDAMDDRSPMRRADLKVVMEMMLEEMGKLLDAGDELVLPPLGKMTVKKRVERSGGDMLTVKLKRLPDSGMSDDTDT